MNATLPATMSDAVFALTLALLILSPLTIAGVALINTGLGRSRSAAQSLLGNLAIVAVTAIVFAIIGSALCRQFAGRRRPRVSHRRQAVELARRRSAADARIGFRPGAIATRTGF